jgi:hypothetical protein
MGFPRSRITFHRFGRFITPFPVHEKDPKNRVAQLPRQLSNFRFAQEGFGWICGIGAASEMLRSLLTSLGDMIGKFKEEMTQVSAGRNVVSDDQHHQR